MRAAFLLIFIVVVVEVVGAGLEQRKEGRINELGLCRIEVLTFLLSWSFRAGFCECMGEELRDVVINLSSGIMAPYLYSRAQTHTWP